jgi:hypothetical protein
LHQLSPLEIKFISQAIELTPKTMRINLRNILFPLDSIILVKWLDADIVVLGDPISSKLKVILSQARYSYIL